jgi:hypothetical protein
MAGDESAEAFMASVNGNLRNQAAQKANISTFGAYTEYARDLEAGTTDAAKGFAKVAAAGADYEKTIGVQRSALDAGTESQFKTSTMQKLALINQVGLDEAQKKIAADQLKQQQGQGDNITNEYGSLIKKQQDINKKLETDVFAGIPNAVANMQKLTGFTDKLADGFSLLTKGINKLLSLVGLGTKEDKVEQKQTEITGVESQLKTAMANQKIAKTPEQKVAAEREVKYYQEKLKLLEQEKEVIAKEEKNAAIEAEIDKRAADDAKIKRAALDKAMSTATLRQKLGIDPLSIDQKKAQEEYNAATKNQAALRSNTGGARDTAKSNLVASGFKPTKPQDATAPQGATASRETLEQQGIKLKKGDVQGEDKELSPKIIELAKSIQENIQGFGYFSAFNDNFHNEKASSSKHTKGLAADFALDKKPTPEQGKELVTWLNKQGASLAIDEYNNPSPGATSGHIHVEIPTFAEGGDLAAGKLGIAGEAGPEFVEGPASITPMGDIMGVFNNMAMMMGKQASAIDELIRVAKNGNDIQTKILRIQA